MDGASEHANVAAETTTPSRPHACLIITFVTRDLGPARVEKRTLNDQQPRPLSPCSAARMLQRDRSSSSATTAARAASRWGWVPPAISTSYSVQSHPQEHGQRGGP